MRRRLRLGLIGLGRWGQVYVKTLGDLADRCQLTHVATRRPDAARFVPAAAKILPDWRELVRSACDAVIVASATPTHSEILDACLAAGKPCLVEKPWCMDVNTAIRLHDRVATTGVPVLVNHTQLFDPAYQALTRALREAAEPIQAIVCEQMGFGPFRVDTPPLWDWGPHGVSLCLDLMQRVPTRLAACGGPANAAGHPELISLRLEFSGGSCAWIQVGSLAPKKRRTLQIFTAGRRYVWNADASPQVTVSSWTPARAERTADVAAGAPLPLGPAEDRQPMERMLGLFLDGVNGGDRAMFGTQLALDVTRVLAQAETVLGGPGA